MGSNHKLLIFSFLLLNLFHWVSIVESKFGIPLIFKYFLSITVLGIIVYYKFKNPSIPNSGKMFYLIIIIFIVVSFRLVVFPLFEFNNVFYLNRIFGQRYFFIPYLLPLIIIYTKYNIEFFSWFLYYSFICIIPSIFIELFIIISNISVENYYEQIHLLGIFDIGCIFLLFTAQYFNRKYIFKISFLYFLLYMFMISFYGRRGLLIEGLIILFFITTIRLKSSLLKVNDRFQMYFWGILILMLFMVVGRSLVESTYAFQRGFNKVALLESRSGVMRAFFYDFRSTNDWLFGRGIEGTVLRSLTSYSMGEGIENGFLTILLKGGLLYSVPLLIILFRAIYLGFFKSNNDLTKALASFILIYFITMAYFNLPDYSTKYIFLWIAVSVCFSPDIRKINNDEIAAEINSRFK